MAIMETLLFAAKQGITEELFAAFTPPSWEQLARSFETNYEAEMEELW